MWTVILLPGGGMIIDINFTAKLIKILIIYLTNNLYTAEIITFIIVLSI